MSEVKSHLLLRLRWSTLNSVIADLSDIMKQDMERFAARQQAAASSSNSSSNATQQVRLQDLVRIKSPAGRCAFWMAALSCTRAF